MAGESIRNIVQRCYNNTPLPLDSANSELDSTGAAVAPAASSGPLAPVSPNVIPAPVPPTIQEIVGRCYATTVLPNSPNPLDQTNPPGPADPADGGGDGGDGDGDPGSGSPGDIIRDIVGRCYPDLPIQNTPNDKDGENPAPKVPVVVPDPEPTPREIIQNLVGRCYPDLAPDGPFKIPDQDDINFDYDVIDIGIIEDWIKENLPEIPFIIGPKIIVVPPDSRIGTPIITPPGDPQDCEEVVKLLKQRKLIRIKRKPALFKHVDTGEIYRCDIDVQDDDEDWITCVRNSVECMMRPYIGGQWRPPQPDCESFVPKGMYGNRTEICVKNCYPDRIPIYEYKLVNNKNISVTPNNKKGMHSIEVVTTNSTGAYVGPAVFNPGGKEIYSSGNTRTYTSTNGGVTVNVEVNPVDDGNDWDTKWKITSWSGNLPAVGTTWSDTFNGDIGNIEVEFEIIDADDVDTDYGTSITAPSGYKLGNGSEPVFYVLEKPYKKKTVPLFKYYSSQNSDTFLTTNPGQPDSPGAGERATMNAAGMVFQEVLGHVFVEPLDASGTHGRDELLAPLDRYFDPRENNHYYTINPEAYQNVPQKFTNRFAYKLRNNGKASLRVVIDAEHGNAGYNNALGVYLADANGPQKGWIVMTSSERDTELESISVSPKDLRAHVTLGYFLLPDGGDRNSLQLGQAVTFSALSEGYRAVGINTAESNYVLFSDSKWNPQDNKDYTKWRGLSKQFWEDLVDGDDDYDDVKFWHRLGWMPKRDNYEGIQCYVYESMPPAKVMKPIDNSNPCDNRLTVLGFKDVYLQRQDCGMKSANSDGYSIDFECGKCNGSYSMEINKSQTITVQNKGKLKLVSQGGITGGLLSGCTRFRMRLLHNGVVVYNKKHIASQWPAIGEELTSAITVAKNDTLTFEVPAIISGHPNGSISLGLSLQDNKEKTYSSSFNINLYTLNSDDIIGEDVGAPASNPILETKNKGRVRALGMQYRARHMGDDVWAPGSHKDESYSYSDDSQAYPWTMVWNNGSDVSMNSIGEYQPSNWIYNNGNRGFDLEDSLHPNWSDGYIDTGILYEDLDDYRGNDDKNISRRTGNYTKLLQDHLITRWETTDDEEMEDIEETLETYAPITFAIGAIAFYHYAAGLSGEEVRRPYYINAIDNKFDGNPFESPITFIHDYELHNDDMDKVTETCKIRVGFTFYCPLPGGIQYSSSKTSGVYWQCIIRVMDVLNEGKGYSEEQEFVLHWPPRRRKELEDEDSSPYFPDYNGHDLPRKMRAYFEDDFQTNRSPKEAFYQESHRQTSPIWYYSSSDNDYRVTFKVIVKGIN